MPTSNTATNGPADARDAAKYSRRAFGLLVPGFLLTLAGCSIAHADAATPLASATPPTSTPRPKATSAPTATPSPTSTPSLATAIAKITPRPTPPGGLPSTHRMPPERIVIPRIGIDSKIVSIETKLDSTGDRVWETAAFAVGHHRGSANPGERGNVVLSGHISSIREGAVFKRLPEVAVGDGIVLMTAEQNYLYKVARLQTVTPDHLEALAPTEDETVTVITCVPDGVYTHRLIVTAKRVQPPPETRG
jgi:sortase A